MQQEHFSSRLFWIKLTGSKWNQNWSAKTKISLSENYTLINLHKMPEDISRWTTMTKKSYENKQTLADDSQRSSLFDHHQSHQYIFHNLEPYSAKRKKHVHIVTLVMNRTQSTSDLYVCPVSSLRTRIYSTSQRGIMPLLSWPMRMVVNTPMFLCCKHVKDRLPISIIIKSLMFLSHRQVNDRLLTCTVPNTHLLVSQACRS